MLDDQSTLNASNLAFVEELYAQYLADRDSVDARWQSYFDGWSTARSTHGDGHARIGPSFGPRSIFNPPGVDGNGALSSNGAAHTDATSSKQARVDEFVRRWRERGHLLARIDPLGFTRPARTDLELAACDLGERDLDSQFRFRGKLASLRAIVAELQTAWAGTIGVQLAHIEDDEKRAWLIERFESRSPSTAASGERELTRDERLSILGGLTNAIAFEDAIQKKFVGAKRFSVEGSESLIPALEQLLERCGEHAIEDVIIGMAHRGRLNVLAHVAGKRAREIFREFSDLDGASYRGSGDVKYHLGWTSERTTRSKNKVRVSLCFNPSHLEFVNPVALGRARAAQERRGDEQGAHGLALLIHGDAAFAGQGIVQETLNLSQLPGYRTGGTLHVVVNNQVGFTTDPEEGRSTTYCTDVALFLQVPILHVNGEDPEACCRAMAIALDYRQKFGSEVVVDLVSFRRYGHNESDEPAFTQPLLYKTIRERKPTRDYYLDKLVQMEVATREQGDELLREARARLDREFDDARDPSYKKPETPKDSSWKDYRGGADAATPEIDTGVPRARLTQLLEVQTKLPAGFKAHPKIERWLEQRVEMSQGKKGLDWAAGEALAWATLATQGHRVRLTGQDCERGTFTHRHSVLHDPETGREYMPLAHLAADQARIEIVNSPLSEAGVMGFEYGFSLDTPRALVMWEAQFGDFVNAAQVILDQFVTSGEEKWKQCSGLTLLLPHSFEGQGPEHSSARLERFLQSCANDNMQVVYPTTPAQLFHLFRRQVLRPLRKPLVVMTPKSLLRHPRAVSPLDELTRGRFQRVLPDTLAGAKKSKSRLPRVLLCTGKIYFELEEEREKRKSELPILRVEQLYPLTPQHLLDALTPLGDIAEVVWVQEEPANMGAWRFLHSRFGDAIGGKLPWRAITRPEAASPATGSPTAHKLEQTEILDAAFAS